MTHEQIEPFLGKRVRVRLVHEDENGPVVYEGFLDRVKRPIDQYEVVSYHDPVPDDKTHYVIESPHEMDQIELAPLKGYG